MARRRLTPDELLKRVQEEEKKTHRGKLKIYLGAAPGVGKTYAMLQDALELLNHKKDIVVGIAESHGRKEIEDMLRKFEVIPRLTVEYRGTHLTEFNLDAALKRNPELLLIDEMAHTNAPNLRHSKRWQDINEVLDSGIDVYTTLNIQHIESLNDVVSQIIEAPIKETVPDSMVALADTIEVVDISIEDLFQRLQEGKVYFPRQAEMAKEHFFREGNLIALRELTLRVAAEYVGVHVFLYRQDKGIKKIWPTQEKLLVCVGCSPDSTKIIRTAYRLADHLEADWIAAHVEIPNQSPEELSNLAIKNLRLAEQLGARTAILTGTGIANEILNYAHSENITKIIVAKKNQSWWKDRFVESLADKLIRKSDEIDVYVVPIGPEKQRKIKIKPVFTWKKYAIATLMVTAATLLNYFLSPILNTSNLIMIYLLTVAMVALFSSIGPAIFASILSVLTFDFFFIPPKYSFAVADIQYLITLIIMLVVSLIISNLTSLTREKARIAQLAEQRRATLHSLSQKLANVRGIDKLLEIAVKNIAEVFNAEVMALIPEKHHLILKAKYNTNKELDDKEKSVAKWVFDLGQMAGLGTDTLTFFDSLYLPLLTSHENVGVLKVRPLHPNKLFSPEQMNLLEAFANHIALALEADKRHEKALATQFRKEKNKTRDELVESISHNIHTPLIAVMSDASTLLESTKKLDKSTLKKIATDIYAESEQLSRLINNLLHITVLETQKFQLNKEKTSLNDVIKFVINTSTKKLGSKPVLLKLDPEMPDISIDNLLIQEVIMNLLDNAIKFTEPQTPIEIVTYFDKGYVTACFKDRGPGIVHDEVDKLFVKYYRGRKITAERGLGLGLSICHSIIAAHDGKIWAENRPDGGASFCFSLPLQVGVNL